MNVLPTDTILAVPIRSRRTTLRMAPPLSTDDNDEYDLKGARRPDGVVQSGHPAMIGQAGAGSTGCQAGCAAKKARGERDTFMRVPPEDRRQREGEGE